MDNSTEILISKLMRSLVSNPKVGREELEGAPLDNDIQSAVVTALDGVGDLRDGDNLRSVITTLEESTQPRIATAGRILRWSASNYDLL